MNRFALLMILALSAGAFAQTETATPATAPAPPHGLPASDDPQHKINVGLQLYSLRAQFPKDVPGTMKAIHALGIDDVETAGFYGLSVEHFKKDLDAAGLHASGMHAQYLDLATHIDQVIHDAKALGVEYVTMPWIPHIGRFSEKDAHDIAMNFNAWGRKFKDAGLKFTYHPHGYEFTLNKDGKGTVFDQLAQETDPNYINFELDIFWAYHGGADPVALMQKYPTRFVQMHLKDMRKSVKVPNSNGAENVENDVAMGTGQLDLPAILKEAAKIGITHYYIEDESSHSLQQIPQSTAYVRSIGF